MTHRDMNRRRGFANLEYVLSLPLVLLLLGAIVSGAYVVMNQAILSQSVRRDAWPSRHGTAPGGELDGTPPTLMGILPGESPSKGRISVESERTIVLPAYIRDRVVKARARHDVMGGSWDHQTLPFPPRSPLQPEPRASVYVPGAAASVAAMTAAFQLLGLPL